MKMGFVFESAVTCSLHKQKQNERLLLFETTGNLIFVREGILQ